MSELGKAPSFFLIKNHSLPNKKDNKDNFIPSYPKKLPPIWGAAHFESFSFSIGRSIKLLQDGKGTQLIFLFLDMHKTK